jgi:hypothetical protein
MGQNQKFLVKFFLFQIVIFLQKMTKIDKSLTSEGPDASQDH